MIPKINFLNLEFASFTMESEVEIRSIFKKYPQKLGIYTSAALLTWGQVYSYSYARIGDLLLISVEEENERHLLQPIGDFTSDIYKSLLNEMEKLDYSIKILGVQDEFIKNHEKFCSSFTDFNDRNMANYLYKTEGLANLTGRHYEKKRNLISQAEKLYEWRIEPLTETCKPHCPQILEKVGIRDPAEMTKSLQMELKALDFNLKHFCPLKQKGFLISIDNKPAAFSIYEELNPKTAIIHFEKAEREYKGLYQLINRETAKAIMQDGFEFINREEDMGIEGLRQAKMSYDPIELVSSRVLTFKRS